MTARVFDIRARPFRPELEVSVGQNFASNIDIRDEVMITAHRGFNQSGSDVKLWDLKKFQKPVWTYSDHEMTPVARFLKDSSGSIVSAGQDSQMAVLSNEGTIVK